jgi:hypothetical protein
MFFLRSSSSSVFGSDKGIFVRVDVGDNLGYVTGGHGAKDLASLPKLFRVGHLGHYGGTVGHCGPLPKFINFDTSS